MKYEGICLAVKDIKTSKKFYEEVFGLEVFHDYGIHISFGLLSIQQEFDQLCGVPKDSIVEKSHNMELYFEEEDFDSFIEKLKKRSGIQYLGEVKEAGWGQRSVRIYDPDGHIIEIGEAMKAVVNRFLSSGMSMEETAKRMDVSVCDLEKILNG